MLITKYENKGGVCQMRRNKKSLLKTYYLLSKIMYSGEKLKCTYTANTANTQSTFKLELKYSLTDTILHVTSIASKENK